MNAFRVGITDDVLGSGGEPVFGRAVLAMLDDAGIAWEYMAPEGAAVTPAQAARYDAICAMLMRVTADSLAGPDRRLQLIARFGVGYDTIDVPACTAAGVLLTLAPDGVRRPVATSALTFVLMLAQKVLVKDRLTRAGRWSEKLDHIGTGLTGRTLGSIGLGNIGAELFRIARPLEMNAIAHDPYADAALAAELGVRLVDIETLFRESDFLTVNCPLNAATRGLVDARLLALMKPSAYLVNTARGPIVDERALHAALAGGRLAGAGLDVFEEEPTPASNPLLLLDNVIVTPHAICFTDECMRRLAESAFKAVLDVAAGRTPRYVVNPEAIGRDVRLAQLIGEANRCVQQALPADSAPAQALAGRLLAMQTREPRAHDGAGLAPATRAWIGEALAHARCALFAKYMSAAQTDDVRRRQLASLARMDEWPALVAELRAQMGAGVDPHAAPVQAIVRRWQQLFRDCYCGDDAALEARVRDALMHEPALRLGAGIDDGLLAYLQQAHLAAYRMPVASAGPKPSALMVAMQRAAHQLLETPLVFDDPLALTILGATEEQALRADLGKYRDPMALGLRSAVVVRSRLAEDEWAAAVERGVRQYVILGAGLDTGAYRNPQAPGLVFEVDLPATQAWKRQRLHEVGIAIPSSLRYVPVDFETVSLAEGLARAGFDAGRPAFFSWLGVTMYLDEAAVVETLRFIAGCAKGSAVLLEYAVPLATLPPMMRVAMEQMAARLAERGEPWKTFFEPDALAERLTALGFGHNRGWTPDDLNRRYLAGRSDGLHIGAGPARLMLATV